MLVKRIILFRNNGLTVKHHVKQLHRARYLSTHTATERANNQHNTTGEQQPSITNGGAIDMLERDFNPKNILLMRKITRYEYEKKKTQIEKEDDLKDYLNRKGSHYDTLLKRHDEYNRSLDKIHEVLVKRGLNLQIVKRLEYNSQHVGWADAVFTAGGDGTFLLAASKVSGHSKPVIGINTDPIRSEGVLCLPKKYSSNLDGAMDRLLSGKFKWRWRHRIRIMMSGMHTMEVPVNLHDQVLAYPELRYLEHVKENEIVNRRAEKQYHPPHQLPILALNEVFIGESLSARVSFYELSINDSVKVKQKSSGVTVCTGTGSTSWYFNINHVPKQSIVEILKIARDLGVADVDLQNNIMIQQISTRFNSSLSFDPSDLKMAYAVRDPVPHGIFQVSDPRGFCNKISMRSRMWDAWVVVDGGLSFRFNDGAVLDLEMFDEDALRGVTLLD